MPKDQKYIVFDLDGTLININSIVEFIGVDWDEFHARSVKCPPNEKVVEFARRCQLHSDIIVLTGKPEVHRRAVLDWLRLQGIDPDFLLMRPTLNDQPDKVLKPGRLEKLLGADWRDQILFVVEDRDKMVDEWRRLGVSCFQCAESLY